VYANGRRNRKTDRLRPTKIIGNADPKSSRGWGGVAGNDYNRTTRRFCVVPTGRVLTFGHVQWRDVGEETCSRPYCRYGRSASVRNGVDRTKFARPIRRLVCRRSCLLTDAYDTEWGWVARITPPPRNIPPNERTPYKRLKHRAERTRTRLVRFKHVHLLYYSSNVA